MSDYADLDLITSFNYKEKVSYQSQCDSLGRKTFKMPIVYDPLRKILVKVPVPKVDPTISHLSRNMLIH